MEGDVDDATIICTRGINGCSGVEQFSKKGMKSRK
jgi:hypothetical protein